ncbi:MAG: CYTH domain-containing protein [Muribaculaceae bacterium]|nr:CYTH domain-containing protein [Muribaculaceae bacterium]
MATEIERKFLVTGDGFRREATRSERIRQGYLSLRPEATVRVRVRSDKACITVKGLTCGASRSEWEYEVPKADAEAMLALCEGAIVDKVRHLVPGPDGHVWEVDEFASPVAGLIVAEVELGGEDEAVALPSWTGREVTGDPRYYNSTFAQL